MQQRYYDPVIGRFYSNDPVGFSAEKPMMFNRYAYVNNNPYKYVDPDGRDGVPSSNAKRLGQIIKENFMGSKADQEKAKIEHGQTVEAQKIVGDSAVGISPAGLVVEAVKIGYELSEGGDIVPEASGEAAGTAAGKVTEKVLDKYIGKDAANFVGGVVGEGVSKIVESAVNTSRNADSGNPQPSSNECVSGATCSK